jgi:hypothetical protein
LTALYLPLSLKKLALLFNLGPFVGILGVGLESGNAGPDRGELGIECYKCLLVVGDILFREDGIHGAFWNAHSTVDALFRVNDQKVGPLAETVNRADIDAVGVTASNTGLGNNVGHGNRRLRKSGKRTLGN